MPEGATSTPERQNEHQSKHGILSTIVTAVSEHKAIVAILGLVVVIAVVVSARNKSASPSSTTGSQGTTGCQDMNGNPVSCSDPSAVNSAGNLANAGYMPSGVAYGLDQITQQLNNLTTNLQNLLGGSSQSTGPSGNGTGSNAGGTGGSNNPPGGLLGGNPPTAGPLPQQPNWLWQQLRAAGYSNPIIPSGQYHGPSFSNLKSGTKYTYNGVTYTLSTSVRGAPGSGILYGTNQQGKTVALYGPPSAYQPANVGGTHDPFQSGIMSHNKLFHRGVGVPMPVSLLNMMGSEDAYPRPISGERHF